MARTDVATQQIVRTGLVPALTTPTVDGDVFDAGNTVLYVTNTGAGSLTVTVTSPVTVDGLAVEEQIVTVAAGDTVLMGPWPRRTFGQPASSADAGRVYVNYLPETDASRAVVSL